MHGLLRKAILAGDLRPGTRLVELDLGRRYRVSQATVREALSRLAQEGLVLQQRRRGTYVAEISEQDARDAYAVRARLEELAAQQLCAEPREEVFAELAELVQAMADAAAQDDVVGLVERDLEFHRTVWEAAGNAILPRIWPLVEASLRSMTLISNQLYARDLPAVARTHVPLLHALRSRDPDAAGLAFRSHVEAVWQHPREPRPNLDHLDSRVIRDGVGP